MVISFKTFHLLEELAPQTGGKVSLSELLAEPTQQCNLGVGEVYYTCDTHVEFSLCQVGQTQHPLLEFFLQSVLFDTEGSHSHDESQCLLFASELFSHFVKLRCFGEEFSVRHGSTHLFGDG